MTLEPLFTNLAMKKPLESIAATCGMYRCTISRCASLRPYPARPRWTPGRRGVAGTSARHGYEVFIAAS